MPPVVSGGVIPPGNIRRDATFGESVVSHLAEFFGKAFIRCLVDKLGLIPADIVRLSKSDPVGHWSSGEG